MDENEQFVRQHWERVATGAAALHLSDYCAPIVASGNEFASWQAAREFTEQRLEEIRQTEEEIDVIREGITLAEENEEDNKRYGNPFRRILADEQATLAALKQGLKEGR